MGRRKLTKKIPTVKETITDDKKTGFPVNDHIVSTDSNQQTWNERALNGHFQNKCSQPKTWAYYPFITLHSPFTINILRLISLTPLYTISIHELTTKRNKNLIKIKRIKNAWSGMIWKRSNEEQIMELTV